MGTQFQSQRSDDAIIISPQIRASQQELNLPISRKRRISVEPPSNPVNPNNPLKGLSCLFFKTRLCAKFMSGRCTNGHNCNFAHGSEELRTYLPDRQEIVARAGVASEGPTVHKSQICKKFYRGEVCTYGGRCVFMHVEPGMLGENLNASKGSRPVPELGDESGSIVVVGNGNGHNQKPSFWKTKMCYKWESFGYCPFGERCHFAHGHAELKEFRNPMELGSANNSLQPMKGGSLSTATPCVEHQTKGFLKWEGLQKVSHIYADWIDNMPLRICRSPSKAGT